MSLVQSPTVTSVTLPDDYIEITFIPDLSKFSTIFASDASSSAANSVTYAVVDDVMRLMERRVIDVCGCIQAVSPIVVKLNGQRIPIRSFQDYVNLFPVHIGSGEEEVTEKFLSPSVVNDGENTTSAESMENGIGSSVTNAMDKAKTCIVNDRWEVAIVPSPTESFELMAFANCNWTSRGGTHVNYITSQCTKYMDDYLTKQNVTPKLTPSGYKSHFMVFINCLVTNASYDSQAKEFLATKQADFGSTCTLLPNYLKYSLVKSNILSRIVDYINWKKKKTLFKEVSVIGKKKQHLMIDKLEDAHMAGTLRSLECTLILTEGDSAKALAMAGLEIVGRDTFGVYPLRGKLINVTRTDTKGLESKQLLELSRCMGFDYNQSYDSTLENKGLRYGHIMIMTDQDIDGAHIKGLLLNFIATHWPHLLRMDGFIQHFSTPLLKIFNVPHELKSNDVDASALLSTSNKRLKTSNGNVLEFFSTAEYEKWRENFIALNGPDSLRNTKSKYYKVYISCKSTSHSIVYNHTLFVYLCICVYVYVCVCRVWVPTLLRKHEHIFVI